MAKSGVYIFRCKEQGPNVWYNTEVTALSFKEACQKLANLYLLTFGIGTNYLWIMRVTLKNGETIFDEGPRRMFNILKDFEEGRLNG